MIFIYNKKAVTLVEVLICITLSVLLLVGVMNLFGSGLKGSAQVLTLQDNMETANILMSQIELDLLKATEISIPLSNEEDNIASWFFDNKCPVIGKITYNYDYNKNDSKTGVHRNVNEDGIAYDLFFAKNHFIDLKFKHLVIDTDKTSNNDISFENHAMWVELTVYSKDKTDKDSFTLKRLIPIKKPI